MGFGNFLGFGFFEGQVQRRGVHVNTPKIGSRVGGNCFGGILGFYAVLRRESFRGNLNWGFFGGLVVGPRGFIEEGDHCCAFGGGGVPL
jgi:hypothetical protein